MYITHESYIYSLMFVDYYVTLHVEITYFQDLPLIRFSYTWRPYCYVL